MKLKSLILSGLVSLVFLSGCLKDKPYLDASNTQPIIEFGVSPANGSTGPFKFKGDTVGAAAADTAVGFVIASPQVLTKDITVTIAVDPTQIDAYNMANGTSYTMLPANLYSIPNLTVTIPAGFRAGRMPIHLDIPNLPATHLYALPLSIKDGGGLIISGNSGTFMWLFKR